MSKKDSYPATLKIDYPKKLDRVSTFFRIFWIIPIIIVLTIVSGTGFGIDARNTGTEFRDGGMGIAGGLFIATALMIIFRQRYPKWWFDFNLELNKFSTRVGAYLALLTDEYPSTVEEQKIHLDAKYPNVEKDLDRWLPLFKWLLAIPHYFVLIFLIFGAGVATIIAWFSIVLTGNYPKGLFDYVVGVGRWSWRVTAYAFLLTTDEYPPFSLD